jgi:putative molybdopterin biosynthesis protein
MNDNTALTPQEVADILKIAKNTVYELIKRGELSAYRVGNKVRVDMKDVEAYKNKTKNHVGLSKFDNTSKSKSILSSNTSADEEIPTSKSLVICGQDIILDILSRQLEMQGIPSLRSYAGSYNGLYALYQGKVQIATCHLWDSDTGIYNIPFVRRMLPGIPVIILHLASRMQGLYVARKNPLKIAGWDDLKRSDITIVNREKGSGTRVLLDEKLRQLGIPGYRINGYTHETTSHLAVASSVSRGEADLGIGNEKTSLQVKGIDFIPLQVERYELVMKKEDCDKPYYNAIIEILNSPEFKMELEGIGGYDLSEIGTIVAEL